VFAETGRLQWPSPALLDLSFRLHHRAVRLALSSVLEQAHYSIATETLPLCFVAPAFGYRVEK